MGLRLEWSRAAEDTLEQLHSYLAPVAGEEIFRQVTGDIFSRLEGLCQFPRQGRVVPELARDDVREVFVRSFRIIYRVEPELISILGVVRATQPLENTLVFTTLQ